MPMKYVNGYLYVEVKKGVWILINTYPTEIYCNHINAERKDYMNNSKAIMPDIIDYTYNSETATTKIKWSDKTITTVTAENPETADQYTGFVTAYAKKAAGNNSRINNLYDKWAVEKPIKDKIAEEKRIEDEAESKRIAEKHRAKKEKWLIQKEALRIKREYEARKLARDKYGIPMDEGSDE